MSPGATLQETRVLTAFLERPVVGPLHLCQRLGIRGDNMRRFIETVDELVERRLLSPPAENGGEYWIVTLQGRAYLDGHRSELVRALMGAHDPPRAHAR